MVYGKMGEIYNVGSGNSVRLYDILKAILLEYDLTIDIVETRLKNYANKINVNDIFSDLFKVNLLRQKE
jgi:hypothetical protein